MQDRNTSDFKIRIDEDPPEALYQEETGDLRVEKLRQRVTILFILIPCILGVILVAGYLDIKKRVTGMQDSGTREVRDLSKDFDQRLASLTAQYAKLEASLSDKFDIIDKSFATASVERKKAFSRIKKIDTAKADKRSQAAALEKQAVALGKIDQRFPALEASLKGTSAEIKALDDNLTKEIESLSLTVDNVIKDSITLKTALTEITTLKSSVARLSSSQKAHVERLDEGKVDQKKFELQRLRLETRYRELSQELTRIRKKLTGLERQMKALALRQSTPRTSAAPSPQKSASTKPETPGKVAPSTTPPQSSGMKPGTIEEQDIK